MRGDTAMTLVEIEAALRKFSQLPWSSYICVTWCKDGLQGEFRAMPGSLYWRVGLVLQGGGEIVAINIAE